MHTRTLLAALAGAAITAVATPNVSFAQQPKVSKGEVATAPSFGSLISAINSQATHNEKLKAATMLTPENVQLVNVEDLLKGNNVEALNNALSKADTAAATALRTSISENATITNALTTNTAKLEAKDVVATEVMPDGKVIVYYWKKAQ
jgi:hypothetical protein